MKHAQMSLYGPVCGLIVAGLCLLLLAPVHAQETKAESSDTAEEPTIPEDAYDRGTPRRSMTAFFIAADEGDFETASAYLDLRNLPRRYRAMSPAKLARALDIVLERSHWIDVDELSDHPEGLPGDGLPTYRDALSNIVLDSGPITLLLQRVPREDGVFIWKISNASVALIP